MCGITGWIDLKNDISNNRDVIEKMSQTLSGRGPDSSGVWVSKHALIGHRRLIVIDPAGGAQPMVREKWGSQYVITYNGELYNTLELRTLLEQKGHILHSNSDTEVLLLSYIEWGPACVERLNGIFAFGIWSEADKSLFLARDRFGVKPLFYSVIDDSLIFGSELKSLLAHPLIKPEIGSEGLAEIFALGPARTPGHGVFKSIREVRQSSCIFYDSKGFIEKKYWSLESHPHPDDAERTIATIKELVTDCITRQLISDVPVCTFLSGGLDSSVITAVAASEFLKKNRQLNTFSIDFTDNNKYFKPSSFQPDSDAPWVNIMSSFFNTQHHHINIDTPQLADSLDAAVKARDLPGMADIDSSLWLFSREIKKTCTVSLSGECADEIFGGYPWFHREELLMSGTFPWSKNIDEREKIMSPELIDMIRPREYINRRYNETLDEVPRLSGENPVDARRREMFYLNFMWFMANLLDRKDRMSMSNGLEVRVPFCDHRLVQYIWNIPWDLKMYEGREKGILRKAFSGVLPENVLWRKKSPYPKTHNPSYEIKVKEILLEMLSEPNTPIKPLINMAAVRKLVNEPSDYGKPWFGQLMGVPQMIAYLIQINIWFKKYRVTII